VLFVEVESILGVLTFCYCLKGLSKQIQSSKSPAPITLPCIRALVSIAFEEAAVVVTVVPPTTESTGSAKD